jgi:hypothetical protein
MAIITSKEKKDIILREVIKPELKNAGYRAKERNYQSVRDDCWVMLRIYSGRFNSDALGFTFGLSISALKGEWTKENLWHCWFYDSIHEKLLLPDCGFLHPYHKALGYEIDGYKYYQPQDMDLEDIKNRITDDLRQYILPPLAEINCYEDWERKSAEWKERVYTKRVRLLSFFSIEQDSATFSSMRKGTPTLMNTFDVSAQDIKENYPLYQQIKAFSKWSEDDKWEWILASLPEDADE